MAKQAKVTLRFATEYAKGYFLGQLSDGWGENVCALDWDHRRHLDRVDTIDVTVMGVEDGEIITDEASDPQQRRHEARIAKLKAAQAGGKDGG